MNCEEIEELSGAYALGALPDDERADVSAHLETCENHPLMADLQFAAASLALAAPEVDPPAALKSRLMDAIRAEAAPQRRIVEAPRRSFAETVRGWFSSPRLGYGLAAAMTVLVLGLVAWNVSLQGDDSPAGATVLTVSGNASGKIIYLPDEKLAVMNVHGLDQLPSGKVYEVWAMTGTAATPIGTFISTPDGDATATMAFDATGVEQIGVTIEDAPGADSPTTAPVFTAEI